MLIKQDKLRKTNNKKSLLDKLMEKDRVKVSSLLLDDLALRKTDGKEDQISVTCSSDSCLDELSDKEVATLVLNEKLRKIKEEEEMYAKMSALEKIEYYKLNYWKNTPGGPVVITPNKMPFAEETKSLEERLEDVRKAFHGIK